MDTIVKGELKQRKGTKVETLLPKTSADVVTYDNTQSGISATNVQDAIDEISSGGSGMTNPMTTQGDIIVGGSDGTPTRLGLGTSGSILSSNGTTASWSTLSSLLTSIPGYDATKKQALTNNQGTIVWAEATSGPSITIEWTFVADETYGGVAYQTPDMSTYDASTIFANFTTETGSFDLSETTITFWGWYKYNPQSITHLDSATYSINGGTPVDFSNSDINHPVTLTLNSGDVLTIDCYVTD